MTEIEKEMHVTIPFKKILIMFGFDNRVSLGQLSTEDCTKMQEYVRSIDDEKNAQDLFGPLQLPRGCKNFEIFVGHRRTLLAVAAHCQKKELVPEALRVKGRAKKTIENRHENNGDSVDKGKPN